MRDDCYKTFALLITVMVALFAAPALAQDGGEQKGDQPEEEKVNASAEFQRANKLASYNALSRSIPHYKKVIEAAPERFPLAHFNLGEVYRVKGECGPAILYFEAYVRVGTDESAVKDARRAIKDCKTGAKTVALTIEATPEDAATIQIEGAIFSEEGEVDGLELYPGTYEVSVSALDHIPQSRSVELVVGEEPKVEFDLVKKTYFGDLKVEVDQKGATISVEPLELDAPESEETPETIAFEEESPMEKPRNLPTGKYSVEVTKEDYDRWIRYVRVERDDMTTVDVKMVRSLPSEIR